MLSSGGVKNSIKGHNPIILIGHFGGCLFDEGFKIESANCSRRILYAEWKDTFIAMTFRGVFLVGGDERVAKTEFWIAREKSGSKLITSDKSIAASRGPLHTFPPPWKAIRFPAIPGK